MAPRERRLSDLGEAALIERIARRAGLAPGHEWVAGIGDDAAILRPRSGQDLVLSTDAQVENVHFRFDRETARTIGRRAFAVNRSDLASMGASPVGCLLSFAGPPDLEVSCFDAIVAGFVDEARASGCPLVGGNLSRAGEVSLHVSVVGQVPRGRALRRSGLRAGDALYVTGSLGSAALARLRADREGGRLRRVPASRLEAGRWLARSGATTACIDLSDGLATDLAHLLEGTGLGAEIDVGALPAVRGFARACEALSLDPIELMTRGGEDYELLFARRLTGGRGGVRAPDESPRLSRCLGVAARRIGHVVARAGIHGLEASPPVPHHF